MALGAAIKEAMDEQLVIDLREARIRLGQLRKAARIANDQAVEAAREWSRLYGIASDEVRLLHAVDKRARCQDDE